MMVNTILINFGILNPLPMLNSMVISSLLTLMINRPNLLIMVVGLAALKEPIIMTNYGNLYLRQVEMVMIYQDMKLKIMHIKDVG